MIFPTLEIFLKKAREGNLIPVYKEILADMETPVSAFKKIDDGENAFLLESVEGGEKIGRYSFLGSNPSLIFKSKGDEVMLTYLGGEEEIHSAKTPLKVLKEIMQRYKPVVDPNLPPFTGGAVGYLSYDMVRFFENLPDKNPDDLHLPDGFFMMTDTLLIFDHVRHKIVILSNAHVADDPREAYEEAVRKVERLHAKLSRPLIHLPDDEEASGTREDFFDQMTVSAGAPEEGVVVSNFTKEEFAERVVRCKEYIRAGDVFQVVISQRLQRRFRCAPLDVYRALRALNPSPYMFYLKFGDLKLAGSSPEVLVKNIGGKVTLRPIAGTRPRGRTPEEDAALETELLADPKERSEHIMLVDLGRNDCGRVCEFSTVRVDELMVIERYSHVMHIVSNVTGRLRPQLDSFDVLAACFPAGTLSGAPKIRAMEIIDEMENLRRGPYGGAVGYFGFNGNFDSCITIRTLLLLGNTAFVQAGAGIVADSDPSREYEETMNKARGMLKALEMAEAGL